MSFHQVRQIPRYHALLAACSLQKDGRYLVGIIQCKIRIGRVSCASSVHQAAVVFLILFYTYWNWIYYLAQPRSLFPHLWNVNGISVCKEGFFFFLSEDFKAICVLLCYDFILTLGIIIGSLNCFWDSRGSEQRTTESLCGLNPCFSRQCLCFRGNMS